MHSLCFLRHDTEPPSQPKPLWQAAHFDEMGCATLGSRRPARARGSVPRGEIAEDKTRTDRRARTGINAPHDRMHLVPARIEAGYGRTTRTPPHR